MQPEPQPKADAAERSAPPWRGWIVLRVLFALAGIAAVAWLVRGVGVEALAEAIVPALPWLPLALALEVARIGMDALSSHYCLRREDRVPAGPMFAAHLVAYAVMGVAPLGRATSEVVKASLLARWIGAGSAAALGTANQANTLISSGTFTLLSAAAAYALTGPSILTGAFFAHFVLMNASGLAIRALARYERLGAWLADVFPWLARHVGAFHATSRETALVPMKPVLAMMAGRALQAASFGVLAMGVGLSPGVLGSLAVHGVYLVVAALGVMIPGQLGASEGGFAYSAEMLGTTEARAMSIALLAHAIQLALVGVGFAVLALWPKRGPLGKRSAAG